MSMIVTANHLRYGTVVYLGSTGNWLGTIDGATVAVDDEQMQRLQAMAAASVERCEVTAVYAFAVDVVAGRPVPVTMREKIRAAKAPTI